MKTPLVLPRNDVEALGPISLVSSSVLAWRSLPAGLVASVLIGLRYGWWGALPVIVIATVFWVLVPDRRIDVDRDGMTFVPLVPLRPRQRIPFRGVTPFAVKPRKRGTRVDVVRTSTGYGASYRIAGIWPREALDIVANYSLDRGAPPLSAEELAALLERYRKGEAPASL